MDEEKLAQVIAVTGCSREVAIFHMEAQKGDVNKAAESIMDSASTQTLHSTSQTSVHRPPNVKKTQSKSERKIMSINDYSSESSESEDGQKTYSGGEKSGLMMRGPPKESKNNDSSELVKDILNQAKKNGESQPPTEEKAPVKKWGAGIKLGDSSAPSTTITSSDVFPSSLSRDEVITRRITFYQNGFLIHDFTFHLYSNPQTQQYLEAFKSGKAPTELLGVRYDQQCEIKVDHKMEEEYTPPKIIEKFSGTGYSLGGPSSSSVSTSSIPGAFSHPSTSITSAIQAHLPPPIQSIDPSAPSTTLQIRLSDGTRLVSQFNTNHRVSDVMEFIRLSRPGSTNSVLVSGFPQKVLVPTMTLEEAGVLGSVIIEKRI